MPLPLLPNARQQFFGSDGKPLAGGKVFTYAAGTSTPKATYTDAAGTVPNTNPIILDARGEAVVFWTGNYKIVLKTAADVTIYTLDNVTTPDIGLRSDLAGTGGAALVGVSSGVTVQAALDVRAVRIATLSAAKALDLTTRFGGTNRFIITERGAVEWVKHTGAALDSASVDRWWFTDAAGSVWKINYTGKIDPMNCGAVGDGVWNFGTNTGTGTDDRLAVQSAFDYFQTQGLSGTVEFSRLHNIASVQAAGPSMNLGIAHYGDGISVQRVGYGLCGMMFTASAATVNYRGYHVSGGGKIGTDAATTRVVDATGYPITATVAAGSQTVTLSAGSGANFAVGDIVFLRTGQCLAGLTTEPDSELNEVEAVSGDTITLRYPALVTYAQEYYKSGTTGVTTTTVTANPAPFTLAKVTSRVLTGVRIDIDLIGHNPLQVLNIWGARQWYVAETTRIWHGYNGCGQRETRFGYWGARLYHTGRVSGYWFAPSTGCSDIVCDLWGQSPDSYSYFHFHEGVKKVVARSVNGSALGTGGVNGMIDVLARAYKLRFDNVALEIATANVSSIVVGQVSDTDGQYCDGGVSFGGVTHFNNSSIGSAILINGANVSFDSSPFALGTNDRLSNVTYTRNPTYGIRIGDSLIGPFLYDRQLILGSVGQDTEVEQVFETVTVAPATGDRLFRVGYSGTPAAFVSAQVIAGLALNDVIKVERGTTTKNGAATTNYAGTQMGLAQTATRQLIAEIDSASGTTNFTAGAMRVRVTMKRTARTS